MQLSSQDNNGYWFMWQDNWGEGRLLLKEYTDGSLRGQLFGIDGTNPGRLLGEFAGFRQRLNLLTLQCMYAQKAAAHTSQNHQTTQTRSATQSLLEQNLKQSQQVKESRKRVLVLYTEAAELKLRETKIQSEKR